MTTRCFAALGAATGALLFVASPVIAQQYPTRPIKIVVPYAAGGTAPDAIVARLSAAFATSAQAPEFKTFGAQSWVEPFYRPTPAFARAIEPEKTMYTQVIARLGTR
jgi:tripartite-type tricarboxylate transporter receptor subunit TctC